MKPTALLTLALIVLSGMAQAQPDKQKLRDAIKLPSLSFAFGVGFSAIPGKTAWREEMDPQGEIAALRKALQEKGNDAERWQALGSLYEMEGDKSQAQSAFTRALSLYRQQTKAQPHNASL